jgi:hypothetical protein
MLLITWSASLAWSSDHPWAHRYLVDICHEVPVALGEGRTVESLFVAGATNEDAALDLLRDYNLLGAPLNRAIRKVFRARGYSFVKNHDFSRLKKDRAQALVDEAIAQAEAVLDLPNYELNLIVQDVLSELKSNPLMYLQNKNLYTEEGKQVNQIYLDKTQALLFAIETAQDSSVWDEIFRKLLKVRVMQQLDQITVLPKKDEAFRGSETLELIRLKPLVGVLRYLRIYINTIPVARHVSSRSAVQWGFEHRRALIRAKLLELELSPAFALINSEDQRSLPVYFGLKFLGHYGVPLRTLSPVEISSLGMMEWSQIEPLYNAITLQQREEESFLLAMRESVDDLKHAPGFFEFQERFVKQVNTLSAALPGASLLGKDGELNTLFREAKDFQRSLRTRIDQLEPCLIDGEHSCLMEPELLAKANAALQVLKRYQVLIQRLLAKEEEIRDQARSLVGLLKLLKNSIPKQLRTQAMPQVDRSISDQEWLAFAEVFEQILSAATLQRMFTLH